MVVHDRWFLTPAVEITRTDSGGNTISNGIGPKYSDHADIVGFSGNTIPPSTASDHYPALTQTFPDVDRWYIVRFYGQDNPGWQALNQIHNHQDTRTLADHASDVAPVLNQHFPDLQRSGQEWADSFKVNL